MKAAEWHGFSLDCAHDLDLLPVVDFSFSCRCLTCGGILPIPWTQDLAAMNLEMLREHAEQALAAKSEQEIPEFTA